MEKPWQQVRNGISILKKKIHFESVITNPQLDETK